MYIHICRFYMTLLNMFNFCVLKAVYQKTITEAIIYYTIYLLELAVNVPNPDAGRKVCFLLVMFQLT